MFSLKSVSVGDQIAPDVLIDINIIRGSNVCLFDAL
jgi:hypothetical protein